MISLPRSMGHTLIRLGLLALVALALFPPGPTAPAHAQDHSPPTPEPGAQVFLPAIVHGTTAPDLVFTPDTVKLAPGEMASVQVRVEPQADLRRAGFELPGVQDGVSSRFEVAADGASGTLTLVASLAAEAGERALLVQGTSGDGRMGWVGKLQVTTTASPTAKTVFVNPVKGNDANSGSQSKPFKTLTHALTVVQAGDTIRLANGRYSNASDGNGEIFSSTLRGEQAGLVPAGVTILGESNSVILEDVTHVHNGMTLAGDATVRRVTMTGFLVGVFATQGKLAVSDLHLKETHIGLNLSGTVQASLTNSTITMIGNQLDTGVSVGNQARFTMKGGRIQGAEVNCKAGGADGIRLLNAARATLKDGAVFQNVPGNALDMGDTARATLLGITINRENPPFCQPGASVALSNAAVLTIDQQGETPSTLSMRGGQQTIGIFTRSSGQLTINGTKITNHTAAAIQGLGSLNLTLGGGASISQNGIGIDALNVFAPQITVAGASIQKNSTGILTSQLKLRSTIVKGNRLGIVITKSSPSTQIDLGTEADPGGNNIQQQSLSSVSFGATASQPAVEIVIPAVGNIWNPNVQGADANGFYPVRQRVSGLSNLAHGPNFDMPFGNSIILL